MDRGKPLHGFVDIRFKSPPTERRRAKLCKRQGLTPSGSFAGDRNWSNGYNIYGDRTNPLPLGLVTPDGQMHIWLPVPGAQRLYPGGADPGLPFGPTPSLLQWQLQLQNFDFPFPWQQWQ